MKQPDLSSLTVEDCIKEKFRQSIEKHGKDYKAVCADCGVCKNTYYRYLHMMGIPK